MARALRVEYPGAYYHVINRGNRRQTVFSSEADIDLFLEKLEEFSSNYHIEIICYCLMSNHFHLYLRTPDANLSKFMQSFMTSFTISKNRRENSSGHLFQGRFKAFLVEDATYGREVSRYIHLNPVRAVSMNTLEVGKKRGVLRDFRPSSYSSIIGISKCPTWLARPLLLKRFGNILKEQQRNYAKYVEEGLTKEISDPMRKAVAQTVLGTDRFIDKIRRGLTTMTENLNIRRELGRQTRLIASIPLSKVISAVAGFYNVDKKFILRKNSRSNEARQILLFLACKYCRGELSLTEIGQGLGPLTVGALARSRYNMQERIRNEPRLMRKIKEIERIIVKS